MLKLNDYVKVTDTDQHFFSKDSIGKVKSIHTGSVTVVVDRLEQVLTNGQVQKVNIWKCVHCGTVNEARKKKCTKCGTGKKLYQHQK